MKLKKTVTTWIKVLRTVPDQVKIIENGQIASSIEGLLREVEEEINITKASLDEVSKKEETFEVIFRQDTPIEREFVAAVAQIKANLERSKQDLNAQKSIHNRALGTAYMNMLNHKKSAKEKTGLNITL